MRLGLLLFIAISCGLALRGVQAQEFNFGQDLIDGAESGRSGGGLATGYMSFAIDGNQLTAVLRNTSPDDENFRSNNNPPSPAIRRFDFDLQDIVGDPLSLMSWELTALDDAGSIVVLGNNTGVKDWKMSQQSNSTFRVKSRGGASPKSPLYNPAASGGFAAGAKYFTEAILVATFNAAIGASDFNPEVRFEYLGTSSNGRSLSGVPVPVITHSPEPSTLLVWSGLAALVTACRRKRRR